MTNWWDAKCIGLIDLFFSEAPTKITKAKAICLECPIRRDCLVEALRHREAWGVWAGLGYNELRIVALALGFEPPSRLDNEVEHGTERGWGWHRRQKILDPLHETCALCVKAYNEASRIRVAKYRKNKLKNT
jgi:hypothetical protein